MAVWWHWGSWNKGYYLQFMVQWWWGCGTWLCIRSWGWYFFCLFCWYPTSLASFLMRGHPLTWCLQDIRVSGETKKIDTVPAWKTMNEQHIANQFHYSLRVNLLQKLYTWIKCTRNQFLLSIVSSCSTGVPVHLVLASTWNIQHYIARASCWAS
jgi:hypothetical protein